MIKIILSGSNGKMGQILTKLIDEKEEMIIVAGVSIDGQARNYYPVYKDISECIEKADLILDFSNARALESVLKYAIDTKTALILATTGFSNEQVNQIEDAAKSVPVLRSANMSLGINLMLELVKKTTKVLQDDFDIEITDIHHNQKVDSPSGTALMLADAINEELQEKAEYEYNRHERKEKRRKNEIGIHSIRGGNIVGDHIVMFAGQDEVIEITHKAGSRELFARGALKAVEFMSKGKPAGRLYSMKDVIESSEE